MNKATQIFSIAPCIGRADDSDSPQQQL